MLQLSNQLYKFDWAKVLRQDILRILSSFNFYYALKMFQVYN